MRNYYYLVKKNHLTHEVVLYKFKRKEQLYMYKTMSRNTKNCDYLLFLEEVHTKKPDVQYDIFIDLSNLTGDCYENKQA